MKAKVLVQVERDSALEAIRTLDALSVALLEYEHSWPKKLRRRYKEARRNLVDAIGWAAQANGVADVAILD